MKRGDRVTHATLGGGTVTRRWTKGPGLQEVVVLWDSGTCTTCPTYQLERI